MGNVFDYLQWRGDLTLFRSPFGEVDNLVLSLLSYLDFGGIVPPVGEEGITVREAAGAYFARRGEPKVPREGVVDTAVEWDWMFRLMADTDRFGGMRLSGFTDILVPSEDKQFCALTIETEPGQLYLSYRGTSDDLAGWKEDFLLACLPEIPSHEEAVRYLMRVAECHPEHRLTLGGHSKGGNLAVYAGARAPEAVQNRIQRIWSNDGPGFQRTFLQSRPYMGIAGKLVSIVPKSSLVGLLLPHAAPDLIVDSSQSGVLQHDAISWQVMGSRFVRLTGLTRESLNAETQIRTWIESMDAPTRRDFVNALFDVLSASGEQTVSGIVRDLPKAAGASLTLMRDMPRETMDRIREFVVLLAGVAARLEEESRRLRTQNTLRQLGQALGWKPNPGQNPPGQAQGEG